MALEEADALVMVVDARTELARPDYDLARLLAARRQAAFPGGEQGGGRGAGGGGGELSPAGDSRMLFAVSSEHGQGFGELLDAIAEAIPEQEPSESARAASQRAGRTAMDRRVPETTRRARRKSARMGSLSSARLRWRLSGGRMWASRRC